MSTLRVTLLGSGSSGGVPRSTGDWGTCDPNEPKNRRTRGGLMLQQWAGEAGEGRHATVALIDTPPDLRLQLARDPPEHLDAIVYSHDHADQVHGIDDVRAYFLKRGTPIPVYMDELTRAALQTRFPYCFHASGDYPATLKVVEHPLRPLEPIAIDGPGGPLEITPLLQDHGHTPSLGFRSGRFAYTNDVVGFPEQSFAALEGLELWIVDALRERPHPTHAHIGRALEWIAALKPKHAVLTNLNHDVDYTDLKARLPQGVEPAYDGWGADLSF